MSPIPLSDSASLLSAEKDSLRKMWLLLLLFGILLILVGLVAMSSLFITTLATILVLGILLLVGGGVEIVNAFFACRWRGFWMHLLAGILYAVLGLFMVRRPLASANAFTLMIAAAFLIEGLGRIIVSLVERFHGWVWVLINGIVTLVLGVLIWQEWPESSVWVIGLFVGIEMLFAGWTWVLTAIAVRSVAAKPV
jgi:uncharacterized membrane protein HdeD (DUF308 family)